MAALSPVRFEPIFKTMLWGGNRLRPLLGRPASDEPTGEAWLLSDVDGSPSRVSGGPYDGATLRDLVSLFGSDLLGEANTINGRFPLLIKLIDARQNLSVQVHPDDTQARRRNPSAAGKTEAWVILESNPSTSRIFAGLVEGATRDTLQAALTNGTLERQLHQYTPYRGDCIFLRAGVVHAIGADILNYEVQQTSDITYRLYDWNRVDSKTGRPRELHVEDALACCLYDAGPCNPVVPKRDGERELLVECEYFTLERWTLSRPVELTPPGCCIITVIEGTGMLGELKLQVGDTVLVPAACEGYGLIPRGNLRALVARP